MEYGLIGEKLSHSFSKEVHAQLFDYDYVLHELKRDELEGFLFARDFKAINVTIPYKQAVIPYLDEISDRAREAGAVNTIVNRGGKLCGYNTDFGGMCALIEKNGMTLRDKKVLILGSGGTGKTALAVARYLGAGEVHRVSRTGRDGCIDYGEALKCHGDAAVIINTTPCGMYPNTDDMPTDPEKFKKLESLIDAVYNPLRTKLVQKAARAGAKAAGGLYMLTAQAVLAAGLFTDTKIPPETTDDVYKRILRKKQSIVLIGMPGCGKTTVGRRLSEMLDMNFVDTDDRITALAGPIPEIFKNRGEEGFRDIESSVVAEAARLENSVISTGGGAILREKNVTALCGNGRLYFLDRSPELLAATDDRPLSSTREALEKLYDARYGIYRSVADVIIDDSASVAEAADAVKDDFLR